ncbi:hypothetical protein [Pseudomonas typographi]|nr:hypothetical protein [Pseudomonas typographi]
MSEPSKREDLDHKPENAGKVGSEHKRLNRQGETQREREPKQPE